MTELKMKKARDEAAELVHRMEREVAVKSRIERERQERIKEEEKLRMKVVESEKKRLWEEEMEKQRQEIALDRQARMEENRRISKEIMDRKQKEDEEQKRIKKVFEEDKLKEVELAKKRTLEDKKKSLFEKNKMNEKSPSVIERPRKKSVINPFAQKFEEMAKSAEVEENQKKELAEKKNKLKQASKSMMRRSRQMLNRMSKENLKGSPALNRKQSKENMLRISMDKIRQSKERIKASRDNIRRSRTCINNTVDASGPVSRKDMQNYLISQVLFDGEEAVSSSSRHRLDQQKKQEEENKKKEMEMIRREQEVKKQIEEQLKKIKEAEELQRIKQQEANFEAYKKEMESYLNFVCEEKEPVKAKKKAKRKEEEPKKKLKLNIQGIKNQFEMGNDTSSAEVNTTTPVVNKLDPSKFQQMETQRRDSIKKKEYIPVIIDKAAFERTVGMFEKEKREEEEKLRQEERLKQRREQMLKEKERLIAEKKRKQEEEAERLKELERLRQKEYEDEHAYMEDEVNEEMPEERREPEESPEEKADREKKLQMMNIQERIKLELEKIQILEEKQKEVIQRENKKKELMRQIQMEVEKIKGSDKPDEDHTPDWIKLITKKKPSEPLKQEISLGNKTGTENDESDVPKWMKIFQEKSKKLEELKMESEQRVAERQEEVKRRLEEKDKQKQLEKIKEAQQKQTIVNKIEKSKTDIGIFHDDRERVNMNKDDAPVKPKHTSVKDRVKKVKSLILDKDFKQEKKDKVKVEKNKASKIKNLFESKPTEEHRKEVARPKKKIVKVPVSDIFFSDNSMFSGSKSAQPQEKEWKWKTKSSRELHDFINSNKEMLPDSLTKKAQETLNEDADTEMIKESCDQGDKDEENFENYIESVQEYLNQEDEDETETIFKDTIQAYFDLIDTKPKLKKPSSKKEKSNIQSVSIKDRMRELQKSPKESLPAAEQSVGKVDTSFLFKSDQDEEKKGPGFITTDMCASLKNKYENLSNDKYSNQPLYSMKRKLIPGREDIDSMAWKKQQTEYQWKYKQKKISELQKFLSQSNTSEVPNESPAKLKPYIPVLPKIDFAARLADEEKRMEEFESFMDGIHEYLEKDTADENESDFKWQIQSYIDYIEDDDDEEPSTIRKPLTKPENKLVREIEHLPSTAYLKQQLFDNLNKTVEKDTNSNVGRVDTSFLDSQPADYKGKMSIPGIKENFTRSIRNNFEQTEPDDQKMERVVVKRKLIDPVYKDEKPHVRQQEAKIDWKYKKKTMSELQDFINSNKDMAPKLLSVPDKLPAVRSSELIDKSRTLSASMQDKETEFEDFMKELESFSNYSSATEAELKFKTELRGYLDLIDTEKKIAQHNLPSLSNVVNISDIQERLEQQNQRLVKKQESNNAIGKVSTFFKKSTSESCNNSKLMKENIANLLQPGRAKLVKDSFETKPKLKRSVSEMEINPGKINVKSFFLPQEKPEELKPLPKSKGIFSQFKSKKSFTPSITKDPLKKEEQIKSQRAPKPTWCHIEDPEERKNAILAKYGFKPAKKATSDDDDSDIEDYLNYENTEEIAKYEQELKRDTVYWNPVLVMNLLQKISGIRSLVHFQAFTIFYKL